MNDHINSMFLNFPVLEIVLQIPEGRRETEITDILENDLLDERENDPQNDPCKYTNFY